MGARGPVPKRSTQRRRQNKESEPETVQVDAGEVVMPTADEEWHPVAKAWYEALGESGQSAFYEPSDWATAFLIAESISRDLKPQVIGVQEEDGEVIWATIPLKGASLSSYLKAMTALLVTEGDRRRAGVELQRRQSATANAPDVPNLNDYRARLTG